jgi:TolB protein
VSFDANAMTATLLDTGQVMIIGTVAGRADTVVLAVASPPTVVFDMVVSGNRDIYKVALDGQDLVRLTTDPGDDRAPTVVGTNVVFTSFRDGNAELYTVPLAGGGDVRLTTTTENEREPSLSPVGQMLAYISDESGVGKVWTATATGTNRAPATASFGFFGSIEAHPSWAPAGDRLVFMSTDAGSSNLYQLLLSSGTVTPLTADSIFANVEPAWSNNAQSIVFVTDRDGDTELYLLDVASGTATRLTTRAGLDAQPAWLPDGRIVFLSDTSGVTTLRWVDPAAPSQLHDIPINSPGQPTAARPSGVR